MKHILILLFVCSGLVVIAQKPIPATDNFSIEGKVKKEMTVSLTDLFSYKSYSIDSIVITNHFGEKEAPLEMLKECC